MGGQQGGQEEEEQLEMEQNKKKSKDQRLKPYPQVLVLLLLLPSVGLRTATGREHQEGADEATSSSPGISSKVINGVITCYRGNNRLRTGSRQPRNYSI